MSEKNLKTFLRVVNSVLLLAFLLVLGNQLKISPTATGQFFADSGEDPLCEFNRGNYSEEVPIDRCCYRASLTLKCSERQESKVCGTSSRNYTLNQAAMEKCEEEGFDLE